MLTVLYEDNHLIAVNKPSGLPTQPTPDSQNSLETLVKAYIKEKYQKPGAVYLHAVHRLDKAASGIVLFAKTSKALSRMNEQIRDNEIEKIYVALCEGRFAKKKEALEHYLQHGDHLAKVVARGHPEGKKSLLEYEVVEELGSKTLVCVKLFTGRYHQIRAQLAHIQHPIVGDSKYGGVGRGGGGICLHHTRMKFLHPVTKVEVLIESEAPNSWRDSLPRQ